MKIYNNMRSFIADYYEKNPNSHYFDSATLKFFGERVSDMRINKTIEVKEDYQGEKHECYVISRLQRKHPNGPKRTLAYFDVETLEDI